MGTTKFEDLLGKTIISIERGEASGIDEQLLFTLDNGDRYRMYHSQDCCEDVYIEDICGNLDELLNSPILLADMVTSEEDRGNHYDHVTWTFYKLSTNLGSVTIRWYGSSNGYYSEEVTFAKI